MKKPQDLFDAAVAALKHSYSPYSNFTVAAALRAEDGSVYAGCNIENASYGATICAERAAISHMVAVSGQHKIKEVLVITASDIMITPCGICRQQLDEFTEADTLVHLCTLSGQHQTTTMGELLPGAFSKQNLEG